MGIATVREANSSDGFRRFLESTYQRTSLVQMNSGSTIPLLRHHLWLVVRGMVKLGCVTIDGDELLLGLAGPNELFGESLAGLEAYEAKTLCHCDLLCLSMAELEQDPSLTPALVKAISQRQRQSQSLLALMGLKRVEDRVKGLLELLAMEYGIPCAEGLRLTPRLTHQELASALGTTRVTVTRIIGQLKDIGWLSLDSQRSIILSPLPRR
ncbi:MAG: Crp/Fnr family transcriptional regulator [Cyanobacteria bacterium K_Offshore_surface_m2_239]|nr:Crp/Fnr family transcriptional regulator [Cyanobacteria bacterium K_Offshore_surface_m2_239]